MNEIEYLLTDHLFLLIPKHTANCGALVKNGSVTAEYRDDIQSVLDQSLVVLKASSSRLLCDDAIRDLCVRDHGAAAIELQRGCTHQEPTPGRRSVTGIF